MKRISFLLIFIAPQFSVYAQNLYWPRDLKKTYKNETRSNDGWPGQKYWQNTGHYNITLTTMPPDRNIKGSEKISYINNSPDTLNILVFKFIQNIHKPGRWNIRACRSRLFNGWRTRRCIYRNGKIKKMARKWIPFSPYNLFD